MTTEEMKAKEVEVDPACFPPPFDPSHTGPYRRSTRTTMTRRTAMMTTSPISTTVRISGKAELHAEIAAGALLLVECHS